MDRILKDLIARRPKKSGGRRNWGSIPGLKKDILAYYLTLPDGEKKKVSTAIGVETNVISRWNRSRKEEMKASTARRKRQSKTTTLGGSVSLDGATVKRTPSGALIDSLRGMRRSNMVAKIKVIDALSSAGYKEEDVLPHINTLPSVEEWEDIKAAILLVSKEYNLTEKE